MSNARPQSKSTTRVGRFASLPSSLCAHDNGTYDIKPKVDSSCGKAIPRARGQK